MISVFGEGRIVADPEVKEVGETVVVSFSVVSNEFRKVQGQSVKEPHYFDCKAWDTGGRTIAAQAHKGDTIVFTGRPRQEKWEDKVTGQKRSKIVLRIEEFHIIKKLVSEVKDDEPVAAQ